MKLSRNDIDELKHKIGILVDDTNVQESYGITQEQAEEIFDTIPNKPGEWIIPDWMKPVIVGEMEDHVKLLRDIAKTVEPSKSLPIYKQASRLEKMFQ